MTTQITGWPTSRPGETRLARSDAAECGAAAAITAAFRDVQAVGLFNSMRHIIEKSRAVTANSLAGQADRTPYP